MLYKLRIATNFLPQCDDLSAPSQSISFMSSKIEDGRLYEYLFYFLWDPGIIYMLHFTDVAYDRHLLQLADATS